jgi:hypothetical protein
MLRPDGAEGPLVDRVVFERDERGTGACGAARLVPFCFGGHVREAGTTKPTSHVDALKLCWISRPDAWIHG